MKLSFIMSLVMSILCCQSI